jgi:hypothetical protein
MQCHHEHPRNVYLNEADIVPALGDWILKAFEPSNIRTTLAALHYAQTCLVGSGSARA